MSIANFIFSLRPKLVNLRSLSNSLRHYVFPEVKEKELEEQFIHGSGPGGQCVNKANNCVLLKHLPTGIVVRVHESRSVDKNRQIARQRIQFLIDNHLNGENSYLAQKRRKEAEASEKRREEDERRRERKNAFKKLLALEQWKEKEQDKKEER